MVRSFMELSRIKGDVILDPSSSATGFWMLYGTPYAHGEYARARAPFIWSESLWSDQKLRDVPDRLDGHFILMPLHLR